MDIGWTLIVPCGEGSHEVVITLKNGEVEIFSPCRFLPETARKLAKSDCIERSLERVFELIIDKALKDKEKKPLRSKEKKFLTKVGSAIIKGGDEFLRYRTVKALGEIKSPYAVDILIESLKDENRWVRYAAAEALGKIGDTRAVEPLVEALKDEYNWVRYAAAKASGKLKHLKAVERLTEALKDEDEFVREAAKEALTYIQEPFFSTFAGDRKLRRRKRKWTLTVQCGSGSHEVTIALNEKGEVEIFSPCDLLPETAKKMAGSCCLENLVQWLIDELRNGDSIPSEVALEALMTIAKPPPFIKSLKDRGTKAEAIILCSSKVKDKERYEAAENLVRRGDVKVLIRVLKEGDAKARYLAAEALGKIGGWKARKALEKALGKEENEWVRRRIVVALRKIGDRRSIPSLVKALKREDSEEAIRLIVEAMDHIYRLGTSCFVIVFPFFRS